MSPALQVHGALRCCIRAENTKTPAVMAEHFSARLFIASIASIACVAPAPLSHHAKRGVLGEVY
jgi:hypothetical protein